MKKVSRYNLIQLQIIRTKRWKRKTVRNKKYHNSDYEFRKGKKYRFLKTPNCLDFSHNKQETLDFFRKFREEAFGDNKPAEKISLDLRELEDISPAASIVLLAEVYRIWKIRNEKIQAKPIRNVKIAKILQESGFYDLLESNHKKIHHKLPVDEKGKVYIKFATAVKDDGEIADKIRTAVFDVFSKNILPEQYKNRIYNGILECMSNVSNHAYAEKYIKYIKYPDAGRRWWISGYVDKISCSMFIQFYDQGAGIPNTLLAKRTEKLANAFNSVVAKNPISSIIKEATEIGKSGTKEAYRGKGIGKMASVITESSNFGTLRIISHKGECKIVKTSEGIKYELDDNSTSLDGTLVQWKIEMGK